MSFKGSLRQKYLEGDGLRYSYIIISLFETLKQTKVKKSDTLKSPDRSNLEIKAL